MIIFYWFIALLQNRFRKAQLLYLFSLVSYSILVKHLIFNLLSYFHFYSALLVIPTQHCWGHACALHMVYKLSLMGYILPTMHCRSQHCWELLHLFDTTANRMQLSRANNVGSCSMRPFARSLILMNEGVPLVPLSMLTVVTKASFQDGRCQMQRIVGARIDSSIISSASAI